jgi:hypothetical protein
MSHHVIDILDHEFYNYNHPNKYNMIYIYIYYNLIS